MALRRLAIKYELGNLTLFLNLELLCFITFIARIRMVCLQ